MKQPEMSHSPAYYEGNGQPAAAASPESTTTTTTTKTAPTALPAAHIPSEPSHPRQQPSQDEIPKRPLSGFSSVRDNETRASDSVSTRYYPHHSHQTSVTVSPRLDEGSISAWGSISSGAARKEERIRGSLTDHSSYMSGDNHHHGVSRVHKRAVLDDEPPEDGSQDALWMLFRLSIPVPLYSLGASLYTLFALLFVCIVAPFRFCSFIPIAFLHASTFQSHLCDLLVPALHIHERVVCLRETLTFRSTSSQWIYNDPDIAPADSSEGYSVGGLVAVLLLSSILSIALLLAAWTAAAFWGFTMVLGNPDGTERKDDGREAVLGVCRWWKTWLGKARSPSV